MEDVDSVWLWIECYLVSLWGFVGLRSFDGFCWERDVKFQLFILRSIYLLALIKLSLHRLPNYLKLLRFFILNIFICPRSRLTLTSSCIFYTFNWFEFSLCLQESNTLLKWSHFLFNPRLLLSLNIVRMNQLCIPRLVERLIVLIHCGMLVLSHYQLSRLEDLHFHEFIDYSV